MWTITTTAQTKETTALHNLSTCWDTTTKQQRPGTMHAGPSASGNPPTKMGRRTYECKVHRPRGAWEDGPYTGRLKKCINPYTNVIQVYTKA